MNQTSKQRDGNSENSSTFFYKKENEYVMSLPRVVLKGEVRRFYPDSIIWLFLKKINSLRSIKGYLIEVITKWRWLVKTKSLKKRGEMVDAIVIGNGPSQGYLDVSSLSEFKANGGELICINYWTDNEDIWNVIPNYLVISDPLTLSDKVPDYLKQKNEKLLAYLLKYRSINIACPMSRCDQLSAIFGSQRILGFVDQELRMWTHNINPLYPRGYVSMTLYKALALAIWFDYRKIYVIGMDNTYPRNIYCDQDNKFINHEIHAGDKDYSVDESAFYKSIGDGLSVIALIFYDSLRFKRDKIVNLDPYSLTDAFKKIKLSIDKIPDVLCAKGTIK
jgi:hypothetical protein